MISFQLIKDDLVQSKSKDNFAKVKRLLLVLIVINSLLLGVIVGVVADQENIDFYYFYGIPIFIMTLIWCHFNAYSLGYRIGIHLKVLLIIFFYAGFPIYLFQAGGFKSFFKAMSFILMILFCYTVTAAVTSMIIGS